MQAKYAEHAIYRNKPNKMRQYLQQKTPYLHQQIKVIQKEAVHSSLDNRKHPLGQLSNRELKSSLAQLISHTRKRVSTQRSLVENALNASLNIKRIGKKSMKVSEKTSNQPSLKKSLIIRTSVEWEEGSPPKNVSSYRCPEVLSSSKQGKKSGWDFAARKKMTIPRSISKQSDRILNFKPKGKSLYKMSVQNVGERKEEEQFVRGFKKGERLGKGGFSVVWSAHHQATGKSYAVKEMQAYDRYQTHLAQITFSSFFFQNGSPKAEFVNHPGVDGLLTMYSYQLIGEKVFVVYEKCSGSLGEFLFDIYEETEAPKVGEKKKFMLVHKALYQELRTSATFLKRMVYQLAQTLDLLSKCNLVHSDIKTSNILITLSPDRQHYSFKLVDYGSSFFFQHVEQYRLATPQYIPPELVNFLNYAKGKPHNKQLLTYTQHYHNISAIDIWGLGCIMLEIIHGVPLWLCSQATFKVNGVYKSKSGIFGTEKRTYAQILERQLQLVDQIDRFLIQENNTKVVLDSKLKEVLKGCLRVDPSKRKVPGQIIQLLEGDIL